MRQKSISILILSVLLLSTVLGGCSQLKAVTFTDNASSYQKAEVLLEVVLPSALPSDAKLQLEVLDDVTGLAYNPVRLDMIQKDTLNYYVKTAFTVGSVVKYRYLKSIQNASIEYSSRGLPVRFRVLKVNGPLVLLDSVAAWQDEPYQGSVGRISGQLTDSVDNTPLPNLLVTTEGLQTITASDGSFVLEGLTPGTHNFTAIALDGTYEEFQQSATIAANAVTPVLVSLKKRPLVDVSFEVELPTGTDIGAGLKLAGNLYSLGNMYAEVFSGIDALSADLPILQADSSGIYSIQFTLPAGTYLSYKYTLGDGFWNGELNSDGTFRVRELIVPDKNATIKNVVSSFLPQNSAPITFTVTVPAETPIEEKVSLQLNPYDWTAPLPMSKVDAQTWAYTLYNPQNYFGQVPFRYCRNTNCLLTAESEPQAGTQVRTVTPSSIAQSIQSNVEKWQLLSPAAGPTTVTTEPAGTPSRTEFLTGFEIDPGAVALNRSFENVTFGSIAATGANWVLLDPTWSATSSNPLNIEPLPGKDQLWSDVLSSVLKAHQANLAVTLFPRVNFSDGSLSFWSAAPTDEGWWQTWFDAYHRFIIQNADAANLSGASAIILGDPGVIPTMGTSVSTDSPSTTLSQFQQAQWLQLVADVRARFSGAVIGVFDTSVQYTKLPTWLDSVDAIYMIVRPEITSEAMNDFPATLGEVDGYLENVVHPIANEINKPILIGLNVRSTVDAYLGCSAAEVNCAADQNTAGGSTNLDLNVQSKIYNAFILSSSGKSWISGFFSRGYQSAGVLQDTSDSVHGKPANDVLWYWYHFLGGKAQ